MSRSPSRPPGSARSKGRSPKDGRQQKKGVGATRARTGRKTTRRKSGNAWVRLKRRTARVAVAAVFGVLLGAAAVVAVLYQQALREVDDLLGGGEPWQRAGRVLSAPIEVWRGLTLTPGELGRDLQAAGYARVERASRPGDFQVSEDAVFVVVPPAEGPGWKLSAGEVLVSFKGERVASVSPKARARFAPVELAGVRGPENEARHPVTLEEVPDHLEHAVLAMEDARFYEHEGVDPFGIARAVIVNSISGEARQGGSTLTQQVVKNLFLSQERTYERKAREAVLAMAMEERLTKDEILALYLNEIYLGQVGATAICGVDQAARAYFGKPAARLDLGEAATLAGIVSAPNRYSPLRHPERALERRDVALTRMLEAGFIDGTTAKVEQGRPLQVHPTGGDRRAPWLVDAALERVEGEAGEGTVAARGLDVYTTLQPSLQRLAERAVAEGSAELDAAHPSAAGAEFALAAVRVSDGAVVALVGGRDYGASQFDRALLGRRQIGSTVKPLTALFALDADPELSPATRLADEPIERTVDGKRWAPKNHDGQYLGEVSLRDTIVHSRNIPAVLLAERVGLDRLEQQWHALGLSGATAWPSAALGSFPATPIELAASYTVFPGGGTVVRPRLVDAARDPSTGDTLYAEPARSERVASARAAFLATDLLLDVVARGTGSGASRYGVSGAVGGKTGTTDDARDAWFVGFTGDLAVAVWVGFDKGRALGLSGASVALPTWARFVAASGSPGVAAAVPDGLEKVEVCVLTGRLAADDCPETAEEWFTTGTAPPGACPEHGGPAARAVDTVREAWEGRRRLFGRRESGADEGE